MKESEKERIKLNNKKDRLNRSFFVFRMFFIGSLLGNLGTIFMRIEPTPKLESKIMKEIILWLVLPFLLSLKLKEGWKESLIKKKFWFIVVLIIIILIDCFLVRLVFQCLYHQIKIILYPELELGLPPILAEMSSLLNIN